MKRDCECLTVNHVHGTEQAYITDRCRCGDCRAAHAERARWRRRQYAYGRDFAHLTPAAGTARRIEALACLGWSCQVLGELVGWDPVLVHRARLQRHIDADKAARFAALYDRLWDTPAPAGTKGQRISVSRTVALAARRGYVPPMAWDDDEIDDPDATPYVPTEHEPWDLKPCGTVAAARRHHRRGEPLCQACKGASRRAKAERKVAA